MCGLAGFLNLSGQIDARKARALVRRMTHDVIHRGPDDEGYWDDDNGFAFLGHRRLSIIDTSENGRQPFWDSSRRYVGIVNGEIYNYKDLRRDLEGRCLKWVSSSDSEVLINLYATFGAETFGRIDGQFAAAIYDTLENKLILARDATGEKPIYFYHSDSYFAFASELKQFANLKEIGASFSLSEQAFALYLALRYVPAPYSIFEEVQKLEPGCLFVIDKFGQASSKRWFEFDLIPDSEPVKPTALEDTADEIECLLTQSIANRLNSDVPLGLFLSSGVDSALVTAITTKKLNKSIQTFSCGFAGDKNSEHIVAAQIASHLGTEHRERLIEPTDFLRSMESIGAMMDEPNGDRSCVPTALLSAFAREYVTVTLSGDGGDELFAGYPRYLAFGSQTFDPTRIDSRKVVDIYFEKCLPVFPLEAVRNVVPSASETLEAFISSVQPYFMRPGRSIAGSLRLLDFHTYLPGAVLAKVDRMSMRHSLEVRSPFLFIPLMQLSAQLPIDLLIHDGVQKLVLRKLLSRYLPENFVSAPKRGFGAPHSLFQQIQKNINQELRTSHEVLRSLNFFAERPQALDTMFDFTLHSINTIWATIVFAKWADDIEIAL